MSTTAARRRLWGRLMKKQGPKCMVCGKPCAVSDKNTDGTYAHAECLIAHQTKPYRKGAR